MNTRLPLYKKLTVLVRLEPGCLGPQGVQHIENFCEYARPYLKTIQPNIVRWIIKPRYDKSLAEVEYQLKNAKATKDQAKQFLATFDILISDFEENLDEQLAELIEQFFER